MSALHLEAFLLEQRSISSLVSGSSAESRDIDISSGEGVLLELESPLLDAANDFLPFKIFPVARRAMGQRAQGRYCL
jgi:hypothetical protein